MRFQEMLHFNEQKVDAIGNKSVAVKNVHWRCPDCGMEFTESQMKNAAQTHVAKNPAALANNEHAFQGADIRTRGFKEIGRDAD